ncbi:MAG: Nudix family hydrolase [Methylophilales bacterium]|nr:Nudix family hydrolase [Methylophilales bacterium]
MTEIVNAAVAVLVRPDGKVLLGQRPEGKSWAGWWEFPGGKIEDGETAEQGLQRELDEELGVRATRFNPWLTRVFSYPERTVRLNFFMMREWQGEPFGKEGQNLSWQNPHSPSVSPLLPANQPVMEALCLPSIYAITNLAEMGESQFFAALQRQLDSGLRLIQIREKQLSASELASFTSKVLAAAQPYAAKVLLNGDVVLAQKLGAHGAHLSAARLMAMTEKPAGLLCGASCHNAEELAQAEQLGLDYALLGAVQPTPTHPDVATLGWQQFAELVKSQPLPIYALGGMKQSDLETAWKNGGHGIAMMREVWKAT